MKQQVIRKVFCFLGRHELGRSAPLEAIIMGPSLLAPDGIFIWWLLHRNRMYSECMICGALKESED